MPYRGRSVYIPHDEWTKQEKYAVGNSWLVEYINAVDEWYAESMDNNHCQWAGATPFPSLVAAIANHTLSQLIKP